MGYINTPISQWISPTIFHFTTATITQIQGAVSGQIAMHRAAANQTSIITIPITVPSSINSAYAKGAYLTSVEIDYEVLTADIGTSLTAVINKVTRGVDLAVATVAAQAFTQSPTAALSLVTDQHKLVLTLTTPIWIANTEYVLVQLTLVAGAGGTTNDFYGAVANFTLKL